MSFTLRQSHLRSATDVLRSATLFPAIPVIWNVFLSHTSRSLRLAGTLYSSLLNLSRSSPALTPTSISAHLQTSPTTTAEERSTAFIHLINTSIPLQLSSTTTTSNNSSGTITVSMASTATALTIATSTYTARSEF